MMLSVYKSFLDIEASAFSIKVNDMCFIRRQQGKARYFGNYYYPAMAVCCCNSYFSIIGKGISCTPYPNTYHYLIKHLLQTNLGNDIGKHSPITNCKFIIGQCAEPHAANNYLRKIKKRHPDPIHLFNLDSALYFSTPYRPRIKGPVLVPRLFPYCDNCKSTFVNCR